MSSNGSAGAHQRSALLQPFLYHTGLLPTWKPPASGGTVVLKSSSFQRDDSSMSDTVSDTYYKIIVTPGSRYVDVDDGAQCAKPNGATEESVEENSATARTAQTQQEQEQAQRSRGSRQVAPCKPFNLNEMD